MRLANSTGRGGRNDGARFRQLPLVAGIALSAFLGPQADAQQRYVCSAQPVSGKMTSFQSHEKSQGMIKGLRINVALLESGKYMQVSLPDDFSNELVRLTRQKPKGPQRSRFFRTAIRKAVVNAVKEGGTMSHVTFDCGTLEGARVTRGYTPPKPPGTQPPAKPPQTQPKPPPPKPPTTATPPYKPPPPKPPTITPPYKPPQPGLQPRIVKGDGSSYDKAFVIRIDSGRVGPKIEPLEDIFQPMFTGGYTQDVVYFKFDLSAYHLADSQLRKTANALKPIVAKALLERSKAQGRSYKMTSMAEQSNQVYRKLRNIRMMERDPLPNPNNPKETLGDYFKSH